MKLDQNTLAARTLVELREMAKELGISNISKHKKQELIDTILQTTKERMEEAAENHEILEEKSDAHKSDEHNDKPNKKHDKPYDEDKIEIRGVLDLHPDGYGFLRTENYYSGEDDIYVPPQQVRRFRLKTGDHIVGLTRPNPEEKFNALIYVLLVNGDTPEDLRNRPDFDDFTPIFPEKRMDLETKEGDLSTRIVDLVAPIGKGQRGLLVSPPKAGKTTMLKSIANAIAVNHPEVEIIVLLIDERPEEVTDIRRFVQGDVVASTFDELPQNHIKIAELVLERAKRLVEHGRDVVILLDSITRLTRAYNLSQPASGKILSGGIDASAFHKPKRFFGAARNIEGGGSLTIIATALVDTGSRMDDVIYEEFKGTGNMELHLDRDLANLRVYPAVDIVQSGTRRDEVLLTHEEATVMRAIRRMLQRDSDKNLQEKLIRSLKNTKTNKEFIKQNLKKPQ